MAVPRLVEALKYEDFLFTVRGAGAFPLDLIATPHCTPVTATDQDMIEWKPEYGAPDGTGVLHHRIVTLRTRIPISAIQDLGENWSRRGWRIIAITIQHTANPERFTREYKARKDRKEAAEKMDP